MRKFIFAIVAAFILFFIFLKFFKHSKISEVAQSAAPFTNYTPTSETFSNTTTSQSNSATPSEIASPEFLAKAEEFKNHKISFGEFWAASMLEKNKKSQVFYGKVIDQDGNPLANVSIIGELVLNDINNGVYGVQTRKYNTTTDSGGLFEFTGLHGAGLGVTISKPGYENEWKNDVYKNSSGGRSSPTDRVIYKMWSTNLHEALITGNKSFEIVPDGRPHFINLADGTISEQEGGDLKVWIQYTNQPVQGQLYDWSAGIEVINGGLLEVQQATMNSGFIDGFTIPMFVAPEDGYISSFQHSGQIKGGQRGEIGNRYFYLQLKNGNEYGKMSINLFAPYGRLHSGLIRISYAINPSGSRILR